MTLPQSLPAVVETIVLPVLACIVLIFAAVVILQRMRSAERDRAQARLLERRERRDRARAAREQRVRESLRSLREPKPGSERRPVVLVVDDSAPARLAVRRVLEDNAYRVIEADNGRSAWAILQEHQPDIIITDIDMPQMDGLQLTRLIREDMTLADLPVMLMTSHLSYDVQMGPKVGADGFLPKPYEAADLLDQVHYILKR